MTYSIASVTRDDFATAITSEVSLRPRTCYWWHLMTPASEVGVSHFSALAKHNTLLSEARRQLESCKENLEKC
jgi:hypothetical protein